MKKYSRILGIVFMSIVLSVTYSFAEKYDHTITVKDMTFSWSVKGENLAVLVSGKSNGWVGVGFNPTDQMQGADYVLGYVKSGKAKITDDYGHDKRVHKADEKLGGTTDVTLVGGSEKGKITTIEFVIPLNSGDKYDSVLTPDGETVVLLAYGGKRDSFKSKHKFRATVKVNLSNGNQL